jgi:hypothetical protein
MGRVWQGERSRARCISQKPELTSPVSITAIPLDTPQRAGPILDRLLYHHLDRRLPQPMRSRLQT